MGHSTGGLIAALWASQNSDRISALVLNSPWLDLQGSALVRTLGDPVIDAIGARDADLGDAAARPRLLPAHAPQPLGGEWDYDPSSRRHHPRRSGSAGCERSCSGTRRVAAGLHIQVPTLVMASALTNFSRKWHEDLRTADTVLDVEQIAARAVRLGRHVTVVRIDRRAARPRAVRAACPQGGDGGDGSFPERLSQQIDQVADGTVGVARLTA